LLPHEDPAEWEALLRSLEQEHLPDTPTAEFLVLEMARAQWKLNRVCAIEAELLTTGSEEQSDWTVIARQFREDCSSDQALLKLNRYEQSARRAWHKALDQLLKLRNTSKSRNVTAAPVPVPIRASAPTAPVPAPVAKTQNYDSKPMPAHLQREWDAHRRRDPVFDPHMDRSQMSKELRKWFDRQ
jgi:hypothetical protein